MRSPTPRFRSYPSLCVLALGLCALSCRDEQAGPKNRASASTSTGARAAVGQSTLGGIYPGPPRNLTWQSGATLGQGAIEYLGSIVVPSAAKPGETVRVGHYFRAVREPPKGFGFFVHVVDEATGQMAGNLDHDFQGGQLPLEKWPVGKVVEDRHTFTVPQGATGNLRMLLGFWEGDARLPVDQPQSQDGQNRAIGPEVRVVTEQSQALPEYHAHRTKTPPRIDGDVSDAVWQDAKEVTLVHSYDGTPTQLKTTARLLWDDQNLYVAFDCEDPDIWGTKMKRDEDIYNEEVVEIFLDANANLATYNELEVSPNNVIFDAYFPKRREGMDLSWDSGMKTAVKLRGTVNNDSDKDQGWSVEMQIPIARLAEVPNVPPKPSDRWRFNLYRLDRSRDGKREEGSAFSPLFIGDFHALPRFGWLSFDG